MKERQSTGIRLENEAHLREADLYKPIGSPEGKLVQCQLCAHFCAIKEGEVGKCLVRKNIGGKLYSLNWGKPAGFAIDPIEKKPFFHFKPGTRVLSFGTPGCNFRCLNCQNWDLSQAVAEQGLHAFDLPFHPPRDVVSLAARGKADGIAYTYSEPTIFFEYARDIAREAREREPGMFHVFVSNGYFSRYMLDMVEREKMLSAIRIDLKFVREDRYMEVCGGHLKPVLDSIARVNSLRKDIMLEVIALVIPTLNDSGDDIRELCRKIAAISPEIPLHFSRFYPQYRLANLPPTDYDTLLMARRIAREEGIKYAYIGNTDIMGAEDTLCPECGMALIKRDGFAIEKNVLSGRAMPTCPKCGADINIVL
ncbi:MAG: AmmeMemoRadiSam system radical SAM enzyme [Candidatus Micrarchaeia archaeon]